MRDTNQRVLLWVYCMIGCRASMMKNEVMTLLNMILN